MKSGKSKPATSPTPGPTTSTGISTTTCSALQQTILWTIEGNRVEDIAAALRKQFPDEDPAKVLNAAGDHFATVAQADPTVIRGWCLEALREMYRRMVDIGDYAGALKAIRELMTYANKCSSPDQDEHPRQSSQSE